MLFVCVAERSFGPLDAPGGDPHRRAGPPRRAAGSRWAGRAAAVDAVVVARSVPPNLMIMGKIWLSGQPHLSYDHEIGRRGGGLWWNVCRPAHPGGDTSEPCARIAGHGRIGKGSSG
ncbi:hypothetical protein GCM10010199_20850 [Dactylosporangium roseum]